MLAPEPTSPGAGPALEPRLAVALGTNPLACVSAQDLAVRSGVAPVRRHVDDHGAAVDGAGFLRTLFQITIPMMLPIINVAVLFGVIFTFTDMTVVYILTRGGPYDTTQVLPSLAFFTGILGSDLAEGAAISIFLLLLLVLMDSIDGRSNSVDELCEQCGANTAMLPVVHHRDGNLSGAVQRVAGVREQVDEDLLDQKLVDRHQWKRRR